MDYVVENEFTYKGMKCVVVMRPMAHRCGYVGVEEGHPLYGKHYNSYLDIKKEDVMDREISGIIPLICAALDEDDRIRIDAYFHVHGGITYSDGGENSEYPILSDLWWFGFDCGHSGDSNDYTEAKKLFSSDIEVIRRIENNERLDKEYPVYGKIRSCEYVREECKKLADQLSEMRKS